MAIGSMLVAAAALWHARYPDNLAAVNTTAASITGAAQPDTDKADEPTAEPSVVNPIPEDDAQAEDSQADSVAARAPGVSGMKHALANASEPSGADAETTTVMKADARKAEADLKDLLEEPESTSATDALKAFVSPKEEPETTLTKVPAADESDADDPSDEEKVAADESPRITNKPLTLEGFTEVDVKDGLAIVNVEPKPLASEYAVTLTVRNNSDELAVISRVVFEPNDILDGVSTEFATRQFGVSIPSEFALAFDGSDNQAKNKTDQGRYVRVLSKTFNVPEKSNRDIRLAIENDEHIGYGLVGKLTLEYNTSESLDIENVSIAFIGNQNEE